MYWPHSIVVTISCMMVFTNAAPTMRNGDTYDPQRILEPPPPPSSLSNQSTLFAKRSAEPLGALSYSKFSALEEDVLKAEKEAAEVKKASGSAKTHKSKSSSSSTTSKISSEVGSSAGISKASGGAKSGSSSSTSSSSSAVKKYGPVAMDVSEVAIGAGVLGVAAAGYAADRTEASDELNDYGSSTNNNNSTAT
ncbi:hypothetical protein DASC09_006900 [Saccharomycopsis crataegensis]|uniref:Uncharacterized protein n=1 Tax=Saccharomycopsis crataegensis TaxID=43959 RepID=A0AAV5QG23_9ASCO|nr:hypothetical protein DASC09_006900 [Saccharomycopsis crataegensis]